MATETDPKRVKREELDDVVGLAAELQDQARAEAAQPTVSDVVEVARELDVDAKYVEEALRERERRKAEEQRARDEAAEAARQRSAWWRKVGGAAAVVALASSLLGGVVGGGSALVASSRMSAAHQETVAAELSLGAALDREQALVPTLVALSGGRVEAPAPAADLAGKLAASDALSRTLADTLADLPAPPDDAAAQRRTELQYELTGTRNRITVERRRWEQAQAAEAAAGRGLGAAVARTVGLAD